MQTTEKTYMQQAALANKNRKIGITVITTLKQLYITENTCSHFVFSHSFII